MNYAVLVFAALLLASGVGAAIAGVITMPDDDGSDLDTTPSVQIWYDDECDIFPVQDVQFMSIVEGGNGDLTYVWTWWYEQVLSSDPNPIITFDTPGTYLIVLTVTDEDGDAGSDQIEVETGPTRESHYGLRVDRGNEFFDNETTFGNGLTFDQDNEFDDSRSDIMMMAYPQIGSAPLEVFFNTILLGGFNYFIWDFGDGSNLTGPSSAYHTFTEPGNYTVTLIAGATYRDDSKSETKIIQVTNGSESTGTADDLAFEGWNFGVEIETHILVGFAPLLVHLYGSTHGYQDQGLQYFWILEENIPIGYSNNITWMLTEPGIHRFTFVVRNYFGWTAWDTTYIQVVEPSFTDLEAFILISEWSGINYIHMYGFTVNEIGNVSFLWYMNGNLMGDDQYLSMHLNNPGNYEVVLIAGDESGNISYASENFTISIDSTPYPVISFQYDMYVGGMLHFDVEVTGGNGNISYLWDFGDGYTSYVKNPTHSYLANGQYIVEVLVTDEDGDWYEDAIIVIISNAEEEF